jgi:hypothetical protein
MMFCKTRLIIIMSLVFCISLFPQVGINKVAQSTMDFLLVSVSPKASSMGDAYFAVGTGAESIFYNPAGMVETNKAFDIDINYTEWIADIKYLAGSASWNLGNYGAVGISMLTVDYGTIHGTSLVPPDENEQYPLGYIDNGDVSNVGAYSFGLSYAKAINSQFMVGGNIRIAGQNLGENHFVDGTSVKNNASKLVFDVGVKYYTGFKDFRFGMALRNFSTDVKRELISETLPLTFNLGAAIDLMDFINPTHDKSTSLTFAAGFLHSNNYSERANFGLEYKFLGAIALRAGYQTNRDIASWSAGAGFMEDIGLSDVEVNYSFSKMDIFKNVNRLSVGFSF